jgi:hypothetical protein
VKKDILFDQFSHAVPTDFRWSTIHSDQFVENELRKYEHEEPRYDVEVMAKARDLVYQMLLPYCGDSRVIPYDEVMIDYSTSPGIPHLGKNKRDLEIADLDCWDDYVDRDVVWYGFPKHEILPLEKARRKTRLVTASPVHLTTMVARFCQDMNEKLLNGCHSLPIKVGSSKFHFGWNKIMSRFRNVMVDEVDATRWDSRITIGEINGVRDIRWRLLRREDQTQENWDRMAWAYERLADSVIQLSTGSVYRVRGGMKSGWGNTAQDNSIINCVRLAYAWLRCGKRADEFSKWGFCVYGDDILSETLGNEFWDMYVESGVLLDSTRKVGISIWEARFLSQRTKTFNGVLVPYPASRKIVYSAAFPTKSGARDNSGRLQSLVLDGYWSNDRDLLYQWYVMACGEENVVPVSLAWFESEWLGFERLEVDKIQSIMTKTKKQVKKTKRIRSVVSKTQTGGAMCVKRKEFWFSTSATVPGIVSRSFYPGNSGLARLDQFGQMFELWKVKKLRLHYIPSVGSTQSGMVHMGVDFDNRELPSTPQGVSILEPSTHGAVWKDNSLGIPIERVQRTKWMYTNAGGSVSPETGTGFAVVVSTTGTVDAGEVWLDYEIEFVGPVPSGQATNSITGSSDYVATVNAAGTAVESALSNTYVKNSLGEIVPDIIALTTAFTVDAGAGNISFKTDIGKLVTNRVYQMFVDMVSVIPQPFYETPLLSQTIGKTLVKDILGDTTTPLIGTQRHAIDFMPDDKGNAQFEWTSTGNLTSNLLNRPILLSLVFATMGAVIPTLKHSN